MRPKMLDTVKALVSLPDDGVAVGDVGVIVAIFDDPNEAYELEFCDESGKTVAQVVLKREQFEPF